MGGKALEKHRKKQAFRDKLSVKYTICVLLENNISAIFFLPVRTAESCLASVGSDSGQHFLIHFSGDFVVLVAETNIVTGGMGKAEIPRIADAAVFLVEHSYAGVRLRQFLTQGKGSVGGAIVD